MSSLSNRVEEARYKGVISSVKCGIKILLQVLFGMLWGIGVVG